MIQQINLYQPVFRQPRKVFSAVTMLQIAVIVLVGMLAIYAVGRWQLGRMDSQIAALQDEAQEAQAQLQKLSATAKAQQSKQAGLQAQITQLQTRLDNRRAALDQLQSLDLSGPDGFSARLRALGRASVGGVWLTGIHIDGARGSLSLQGEARRADLLPVYLDSLGKQPVFQGTRFRTFRLEADEGYRERVSFGASNAPEDKEAP